MKAVTPEAMKTAVSLELLLPLLGLLVFVVVRTAITKSNLINSGRFSKNKDLLYFIQQDYIKIIDWMKKNQGPTIFNSTKPYSHSNLEMREFFFFRIALLLIKDKLPSVTETHARKLGNCVNKIQRSDQETYRIHFIMLIGLGGVQFGP